MRRDDRGVMAATEAAIIIPAMVLLVGLIILLGRDAMAQQAVSAAAQQGARAASVERTAAAGRDAAEQVVAASLTESGAQCRSYTVSVDTAGLSAPIGSRASVEVTVTCEIAFGVHLPGFPETRSLTRTGSSPVDTYRSR